VKGVLVAVTRWFCRPLTVIGRAGLARGPVVFVANHASHADTAAVIAALPRRIRKELAPAAAEDYWFRSALKARVVRAFTGAFPFPRHGLTGIERGHALLQQGRSILLFPEGTRSKDGSVEEFRCGVGILARQGAVIVPVGLAGSREVFPKGTKLPRRAPVAVVFGEPRSFDQERSSEVIAKELCDEVCDLAARAAECLEHPKRSLYERMGRFARSRAAIALVFVWSVVEALWWPLIPDFLVAPLAIAAPSRALVLAGTATLGSVTGGVVAFHLGEVGELLAAHAPLVTPAMHEQAATWMNDEGAMGLLRQPLSGIPYKAFALRAADQLSLGGFVAFSALARGLRIVAVAAIFAGGGVALRKLWPRVFGAFLIAYCVVFAFGLNSTIEAWE